MKIDGLATVETIDTSGEILELKGLDISVLTEGKGVLNFEHSNDSPEDIVGSIIYAKKLYTIDDCENDRQRMYYNMVNKPCLYIIGELFDQVGHVGSIALASLIRYYHNKGEKLLVNFSIEGSTISREGMQLKRTISKAVACTVKPCNRACVAGVLEDPQAAKFLNKTMNDNANQHLVEIDSIILEDALADQVETEETLIAKLTKTLTAGSTSGAPGTLTQGAALQREHIVGRKPKLTKEEREKFKATISSWTKQRPLKEWIKAQMPEVSDEYVDHFEDLAEDLALKKNQTIHLTRVDLDSHLHPDALPEQEQLVQGVYLQPMEETADDTYVLMGQNDHGDFVILKSPALSEGRETARNAALYYNLAAEFFDLGESVPVTTHFMHPAGLAGKDGSSHWMATLATPDFLTPFAYEEGSVEILQEDRDTGYLHKLALMDLILGIPSRTYMETLVRPDGVVLHIDNETALTYPINATGPHGYMKKIGDNEGIHLDSVHPSAREWLKSLSAIKLLKALERHGIPGMIIRKATATLSMAREMAERGASLGSIYRQAQLLWEDIGSAQ